MNLHHAREVKVSNQDYASTWIPDLKGVPNLQQPAKSLPGGLLLTKPGSANGHPREDHAAVGVPVRELLHPERLKGPQGRHGRIADLV